MHSEICNQGEHDCTGYTPAAPRAKCPVFQEPVALWPGKAATHVEGQFVVTPCPTGQEGVILPDMPLLLLLRLLKLEESAGR